MVSPPNPSKLAPHMSIYVCAVYFISLFSLNSNNTLKFIFLQQDTKLQSVEKEYLEFFRVQTVVRPVFDQIQKCDAQVGPLLTVQY